jgi:cycloartenol synthase
LTWPLSGWRQAGIKYAMEYMHSEDLQTNWICIGPVNKVLNMVCVWHDAGNTPTDSFYKVSL